MWEGGLQRAARAGKLLPLAAASPSPANAAQAEVEQFYSSKGYLFPTFHEFYWFGFQTTSLKWPAFSWIDPTVSRKDR